MLTNQQDNGPTKHLRAYAYWHNKVKFDAVYSGMTIPQLLDWIFAQHYQEKRLYKSPYEHLINRTREHKITGHHGTESAGTSGLNSVAERNENEIQ